MELSEDLNYINYINQFADRKYESALVALEKCLENASGDHVKKSFILGLIADVYFHDGKIEKCFEYFSMSEVADTESLQPKLFFAKFLANKLKNYDSAVKKCEEIVRLATQSPSVKTDDDFGSDYYISKAEEIRSFCLRKIAEEDGGK